MNKKIELEKLYVYKDRIKMPSCSRRYEKKEISKNEKREQEEALLNMRTVRQFTTELGVRIIDALDEAKKFSGKKGNIVSMKEYVEYVVIKNEEEYLEENILTSSEEYFGVDSTGFFSLKRGKYVVITHRLPFVDTYLMRGMDDEVSSQENNLPYYAYEKSFEDIFLPYSKIKKIRFYYYDEVDYDVVDTSLVPYGVFMPHKVALSSKVGEMSMDDCLDNQLMIARAGGPRRLKAYLELVRMHNKFNIDRESHIPFYHPYDETYSTKANKVHHSIITSYKKGLFDLSGPGDCGKFLAIKYTKK